MKEHFKKFWYFYVIFVLLFDIMCLYQDRNDARDTIESLKNDCPIIHQTNPQSIDIDYRIMTAKK